MSNIRGRRRKPVYENFLDRGRDSKRALYHCNYCEKDISNVVRIKCADCPDFDLCLECFSVGAEVTPHKKTHAYRVVDVLSFPLYDPDWGADEELLLLEGVEMYGIGNWQGVKDHVGGNRTKEECKKHYFRTYIDVDSFPLPSPSPAMAQVPTFLHVCGGATSQSAGGGSGMTGVKDDRLWASGFGSFERTSTGEHMDKWMPGDEVAGDDASRPGTGQKGQKRPRQDIEGEGEVKTHATTGGRAMLAATVIQAAAMPGVQGVIEEEKTQGAQQGPPKCGVVSVEATGYQVKRNEFDPDWDNDAEKCIADLSFDPDDSEALRQQKLRLLKIYCRRLDMREMVKQVVLSQGLLNMRKIQGVGKRWRGSEKDLVTHMRVFSRYQDSAAHDSLVEGLLHEQRLRARIQELKECRYNGLRTLAEAEIYEQEKTKRSRHEGQRDALGRWISTPRVNLEETRDSGKTPGRPTAQALEGWRRKHQVALDITGLPGTEFLSGPERELCAHARLLPGHYLSLKDMLLRDQVKNGPMTRTEVRTFFRLDPGRAQRIYDLLVTHGWLPRMPPSDKPPRSQKVKKTLSKTYQRRAVEVPEDSIGGEGGVSPSRTAGGAASSVMEQDHEEERGGEGLQATSGPLA